MPDSYATRCPDIPCATYRLQFNRDFTFIQAAALVPYLADLGISHCYASPYLKARPGSRHGYDIVDHNALNPEIGTWGDYQRFVTALRHHEMGQILDVVPNHMSIMGSDNRWWLDVLENGRASVYGDFFDIDWMPAKSELHGKVLVPVLADQYGVVLESGDLQLRFDAEKGEFSVWYYEHRFPIDPGTYPILLRGDMEPLRVQLGEHHPHLMEFKSLLTALGHLPERWELGEVMIEERNRDKEILKRRLAEHCAASPEIKAHVLQNTALFNGKPGNLASFALLHELLELQAYRLAHWRVASDEINYRRFFDINDLAGLRMENEAVFDATHQLILRLITDGDLQGLRIDHPDGLYDPRQYYRRLNQRTRDAVTRLAGHACTLYVAAEKILANYERLPTDWDVQGTTGYDFTNQVNGLFIDPAAEKTLTRTYASFIGRKTDYEEIVYSCKKRITELVLASDLNVLANRINHISEADPKTRDFTLNALRDALREIVARFPVYRTYIADGEITEDDRYYIDWAISQAKKYTTAADTTVFDFIRAVLLRDADGADPLQRQALVDFAMRFQQYTAPVMAKGLEDTACYVYNRLVSLNEVGGDPRRFGNSVSAFHRQNQERARVYPHALISTSTHDTKRSEDVRARINVLSELAGEWRSQLAWWSRLNRAKKTHHNGEPVPGRNDEYLLYQTLVGSLPLGERNERQWPVYCDRVEQYMLKAVREAKRHTSWVNPNTEYETAVVDFVRAVLNCNYRNRFLDAFMPFQRRVARLGLFNSLSQCLLKLTAPGVPDIYQGTELWDFSLVDPDNRRPVDYTSRRQRLVELQRRFAGAPEYAGEARRLLNHMEDGDIKLYLTWRTLARRRRHPVLFRDGDYLPLETAGARAEHLIAYARIIAEQTALIAAPRLMAALVDEETPFPLGPVWTDTWIETPSAATAYVNVFTGEHCHGQARDGRLWLHVPDLLANFPVALLISR